MSVPSRATIGGLRASTVEAGEPDPTCGPTPRGSVWYRLDVGSLRRISLLHDPATVAVYSGSTLSGLRQRHCQAAARPCPTDGCVAVLPARGPFYLQVFRRQEQPENPPWVEVRSAEPFPDSPPPCDSREHRLFDVGKWRKPLRWRFNGANMPAGLTASGALGATKRALRNITASRNDCGMPDRVGARAEHLGSTTRTASMCRDKADGRNTVAFERRRWDGANGPYLALACMRSVVVSGGSTSIVEADIRIWTGAGWTLKPDAPGCSGFDLEGVVTHEAGHAFGLDHPQVLWHSNLTMHAATEPCTSAARTLGRGDVLGLRKLY